MFRGLSEKHATPLSSMLSKKFSAKLVRPSGVLVRVTHAWISFLRWLLDRL